MSLLPVIEAATLKRLSSIRHGFFTRQGGVSQGIYHSLNIGLGSDDDPHHVRRNREYVAAHFAVATLQLVSVYQYHSAEVVYMDAAPSGDVRHRGDALVTNVPGLALAIATADCAPVLFADNVNGVIAAAHAGWRGAYAGILENTVAAMEARGSKKSNIVAAIGPCIGAQNYQVGEDFFSRFISQSSANRRFFVASTQKNHYLFDLAAYNCDRLMRLGVACEAVGLCTYADEERFFSHRRMIHRGEGDYGRQMSAIIMERT